MQADPKKLRPDSLEYQGAKRWCKKLGIDFVRFADMVDRLHASDIQLGIEFGYHRKTMGRIKKQYRKERAIKQTV